MCQKNQVLIFKPGFTPNCVLAVGTVDDTNAIFWLCIDWPVTVLTDTRQHSVQYLNARDL